MVDDQTLRHHLLDLLAGGAAHVGFDRAVDGLPVDLQGRCPPGAAHTPWQILEHLRIAGWDILEFSRNPEHRSPQWPQGYWPQAPAPPDDGAWERSAAAIRGDLEAMMALVADPVVELAKPFPWGDGHTLLREALLMADHNAYHLGELVLVRRLLGAWPDAG